MIDRLSKYVFYPLWDWKDRSSRLKELAELEEQQWWNANQLRELQWNRLIELLRHAGQHSQFYRRIFKKHDINPDSVTTWEEFRQFPVITKQDVRNHTDEFISDQYQQNELVAAKTGGSTGVSLHLYFDECCQERRNAAQLWADRWAGWDLGEKKAAIWGNPPVVRGVKQGLRHHLMDRTIYLDTMNLNDESMGDFVDKWRRENPKAIFGHAHSIYLFAKYVLEHGCNDLRPKGIVATSMMLLEPERAVIERAFSCKVTNRYGCEEVGLIACECEQHSGMHLNLPHVVVEFLDADNQPVKPGEPGKIVVTDLNNFAMPLIRYRVEDVGAFSEEVCACGRGLPILKRLEGRVADFLKLPSGGHVAGISLIERTLTKVPGVEQMQLVQDRVDHIVINRVKGKDFNEQTDQGLILAMREVFDERVGLDIVDVPVISQDPSGKYRFSICKI
ncbi:phenylacetate--CoA ligase family protein [Marinobacter sp. GN3S48]|uniref:phenylacetate--CoA ligase family protein n=1 Tax=Marinobacter sp. GN3S48 TaxID=3382302 RepID=UPI00387B613E